MANLDPHQHAVLDLLRGNTVEIMNPAVSIETRLYGMSGPCKFSEKNAALRHIDMLKQENNDPDYHTYLDQKIEECHTRDFVVMDEADYMEAKYNGQFSDCI